MQIIREYLINFNFKSFHSSISNWKYFTQKKVEKEWDCIHARNGDYFYKIVGKNYKSSKYDEFIPW